jgi:hypothetical protein
VLVRGRARTRSHCRFRDNDGWMCRNIEFLSCIRYASLRDGSRENAARIRRSCRRN